MAHRPKTAPNTCHNHPRQGSHPKHHALRLHRVLLGGIGALCLVWGLIGLGCGTPVCRSNQDCQSPTPHCVLAQCKQCTADRDCLPQQRCELQSGTCRSSSESNADATENKGESYPEQSTKDASPDIPVTDGIIPTDEPPADRPTGPCVAGLSRPCYDGPAGTVDQGPCKAGIQVCGPNRQWGQCQGQSTPTKEVCDGQDNDCNGLVDDKWPTLGKACTKGAGDCQTQGTYKCPPGGEGDVVCDAKSTTPGTELCDDKDNNCDGQIDETFPDKGKACSVGIGACEAQGKQICNPTGDGLICDAKAKAPSTEICDGIDNNCNGTIDEGIPCACQDGDKRDCGSNTGECTKGQQTCKAGQWSASCEGARTAQAEICDNKDNDCDGTIDDGLNRPCYTGTTGCKANGTGTWTCTGTCTTGFQSCSNGRWGTCVGQISPTPEICDGKDNDCDGQIDETFGNLGSPCSVGSGECRSTGKFICDNSGKGTSCDASPSSAKTELCDGKDNNCNGQVDEGLTRPCYNGNTGCLASSAGVYTCAGTCAAGSARCSNGRWLTCIGQVSPTPEICDGLDNNCNGQVDDSVSGTGGSCNTSMQGECRAGTNQCSSGQLTCVATQTATTESCRDNKDNDCDGQIDEICGPKHAFVVTNSSGQVVASRQLQLSKAGTGHYRIGLFPTGCNGTPVFGVVLSDQGHSLTYDCGQLQINYTINIHNQQSSNGAYIDAPLALVQPERTRGEIFGVIGELGCHTSSSKECNLDNDYGTVDVREVSKGIYEIDATPCANANQPVFVMPNRINTSSGRVTFTVSHSNNKCIVRIYDGLGQLISNRFAFWLPDTSTNAYAITNATGLAASQNFNDQNATWAYQANTSPVNYDVTFHAWANPSALLLSPIHRPSATLPSQVLNAEAITNGVKVHPFDDGPGIPTPATTAQFHVLFVQ